MTKRTEWIEKEWWHPIIIPIFACMMCILAILAAYGLKKLIG